jgi:indole-3-glycerol phosphate synthase
MTVLDDILGTKRESLRSKQGKRYLQEVRSKIADADPLRGFLRALSVRQEGSPRLIAEIKKASPSKGVIREKFHPVEIAKVYEGGGAAALSILTEEHFFLGNPAYLRDVRSQVPLPFCRKISSSMKFRSMRRAPGEPMPSF